MPAALDRAFLDAFLDGIDPPKVEAVVPGWKPQPKQLIAQDLADDPDIFEMLYGGAAGGGKSFWIRNDAVRFALRHSGAHVGIVRRTMPMLKQTHLGPLRDICRDLAVHNRTESTWTFSNGSVIRFISLQHDGDEQNYKSVEFDRLYFDEVTELAEAQYTYMLSRLRSQHGHPVTAICVSNPEGVGYAWVKRRFVSPKPADLAENQEQPKEFVPWRPPLPGGGGFARSRVFVPATVYDNPALLAANPNYILQLQSIPDARKRKALLDGDWEAMDQVQGALWSLSQIEPDRVAHAADLYRVVVAIDPAGTTGPYADETGIIAAGRGYDGHGYVLADASGKFDPGAWARQALDLYIQLQADAIVVEKTAGAGSDSLIYVLTTEAQAMVREGKLTMLPRFVPVHATRGKATRADPAAQLYRNHAVHHVGEFPELEEQLTTWVPSSSNSPDRLDALVWALEGVSGAHDGELAPTRRRRRFART
ncbi:phage terminase large subunit [uncultured Friedmanniella sp.]|uniref:phage terminase large subunit n=1 Tax=uncultured Friedmanniella sp. TaxID=335381 RepID=UPI0035C97906